MSHKAPGGPWNGTLEAALHSLRQPEAALAAVLAATAAELRASIAAVYAVNAERGTVHLLGAAGGQASTPSPRQALEAMNEKAMAQLIADPATPVAAMPAHAPFPWSRFAWLGQVQTALPAGESLRLIVASDQPLDPERFRGAVASVAAIAAIATTNREVDRLREELHRLRQERTLTAASLQHDLRTPLTSILGSARTLERRGPQLAREDGDHLLRVIAQQAERLTAMVSEAFAREISSPDAPPRLRRTNMRELAERVAAAARVARGGTIALQAEEGMIVTDPDRLERALLNLLDNALKYSPDGEPAHVVGERSGERYSFTVADSGPGVAADILPSLFAAFATDRSRPGGTGLGLHSVVRLARELGGNVSYSRQGEMTRFCLVVPDLDVVHLPSETAAASVERPDS
jgi:signal transduction histidine kinase